MMKNSFQAFCDKQFKNNKLKLRLDFNLEDEMDRLLYAGMKSDKKIFVCPHFCKVELKLTNWANGYVLLKYDLKENKKILKKVIDGIEAFTGNRRINEFRFLCTNENIEYDLAYDTGKFVFLFAQKINRLCKGICSIWKINIDPRKLDFSIIFDCDKNSLLQETHFRVFLSDYDDFLNCLREFVVACKEKNLNTLDKIQKEIQGLPLQEYTVAK